MFALWDPVDDREVVCESSEEYSRGADTANTVVNTATAISVLLLYHDSWVLRLKILSSSCRITEKQGALHPLW